MDPTTIASIGKLSDSVSGKMATALMVVKPPAKPVDQKFLRDSDLNHVWPVKKPTRSAPTMFTVNSATKEVLVSEMVKRNSEPSAPPKKVSAIAFRESFCVATYLILRRLFAA
jgi:hypothetical protein